jgi:hypothetical protein
MPKEQGNDRVADAMHLQYYDFLSQKYGEQQHSGTGCHFFDDLETAQKIFAELTEGRIFDSWTPRN